MTCPPCSGDCSQGRTCPARSARPPRHRRPPRNPDPEGRGISGKAIFFLLTAACAFSAAGLVLWVVTT